jgi:hypothetical protein
LKQVVLPPCFPETLVAPYYGDNTIMLNTFHKNEEPFSPFPVIQSLHSPQALVTEVLSGYDIGYPVDCKLLSHNLNDTYLVSVGERCYILLTCGCQAFLVSGSSYCELGLLGVG